MLKMLYVMKNTKNIIYKYYNSYIIYILFEQNNILILYE